MKLSHLCRLAEAAELGLPHLERAYARDLAQKAIEAAYLEARKRFNARDLNRANRPSQTVRRKSIRKELLGRHHRARLTRAGQWLVQEAPGSAWLLYALSDSEAENLITANGECK